MKNSKETTLLSNMSVIPMIVFIVFSSIMSAIMFNYHHNHIEYMTKDIQQSYTELNKTLVQNNLDQISAVDIQKHIDKKVIKLQKEHQTYLMQFIYMVLAVIIVLIVMLLPLSRQIKKLFLLYKQKIIQIEKNNTQKSMIIYQQSKMTMISELLSMIHHQWKEPLSKINVATLNMYLEQKEGSLDEKVLKQHIVDIENTTEYLARTIDDFSHFFVQESREKVFLVNDSIDNCMSIVSPSLRHVNLRLDFQSKKYFSGYIVLFQQIILSLISNSMDVFNTNNISNPEISIFTYDEKDFIFIEISDNGGGIPKENFKKIFDLYFSTKKTEKKNGLGLYIVKEIVEKNFHGKIKVTNMKDGVKFTIRIPCFDNK